MTNKLEQNYPQFFELNGIALNDGYIYIGVDGLDPTTNPKQVYLDDDLTTPISQPLRTTGGYVYYNGNPVSIYFDGTYSITVKNSLSEVIYINLHAFDLVNSKISIKDGLVVVENIASLKLINGANVSQVKLLGYYTKGDGGGGTFYWDSTSTESDNGGTIIQATGIITGRWKRIFNGAVDIKWFGAKSTLESSGTDFDSHFAIQKALDSHRNIIIPEGAFAISQPIVIDTTKAKYIQGVDGGLVTGAGASYIWALSSFVGNAMISQKTLTTATDPNRVVIEHLFINCNEKVNIGIHFNQGLASSRFTNVSVFRPKDYGFKFENNITNSIYAANIELDTCYVNMPNNKYFENPSSYPNTAAYFLGGGFFNLQICTSDGGNYGLLTSNDDITSLNTIDNCHFEGWIKSGIKIQSLNGNYQITNNQIMSIYGTTNYPDVQQQIGIELVAASSSGSNIITDNVIKLFNDKIPYNANWMGIYIKPNSVNNIITSNVLTNFYNGIVIDSSFNTMSNNTVMAKNNSYSLLSGINTISGGYCDYDNTNGYAIAVSTYNSLNKADNIITPYGKGRFINILPKDYGCNVECYQNSSQTLNNVTYTKLLFQNEVIDTASSYNSSNSIFTAPETGFYLINTSVRFATAPSVCVLESRVQGVQKREMAYKTSNTSPTITGTDIVYLEKGWEYNVYCLITGTISTVATSNSTYLNIALINKS